MSTSLLDAGSFAARSGIGSSRARTAGRLLSALAVLLLAVDTAGKLLSLAPVVEGTVKLGYPPQHVLTIGVIELACLALYLVPRTATAGAVLWTGYLGGAIATHFRLGNPLLTHTLFPIYVAALLWGGLYLRDERARAMFRGAR